MNTPNLRGRLVIDDGEAHALLWRSEDLLLQLAANEEHAEPGTESWHLPQPLAGRVALDALYRIWDAPVLVDEQCHPSTGRTLAPDGRYEHAPLRLIPVDQHDIDLLFAAAATCNQALTPGFDNGSVEYADLRELLHAIEPDPDLWPNRNVPDTPGGVVDPLVRLVTLLDLAPDTDIELLTQRLTTDNTANNNIVLSPNEEAAYQRFATRWVAILSDGDPLQRWLY